MVVFDATMLMLAIRPGSGRPVDPFTGVPIEHVRERMNFLISELDKSKTKIGIPTPALSEVLVRAGNGMRDLVDKLSGFSVFQILMFDELSAIEVALFTKGALDRGDKRDGSTDVWSKIKYDRQIAAIAKRNQATAIYTDDVGLRSTARRLDISVVGLIDLILPPEKAQIELLLHPPVRMDSDNVEGLAEIDAARDEAGTDPS